MAFNWRFWQRPPAPRRRIYAAAASNRLTADWITSPLSAADEVRGSLSKLRDRSRELERNDEYFRRYLDLCVVNMTPLHYQSAITQLATPKGGGRPVRTPDSQANDLIETAWEAWGRAATVVGDTWGEACKLAARTVARDGELLVQLVRGETAGNAAGFALRLLEADYLDHTLCRQATATQPQIVSGVEVDGFGRPLAYHLYQRHPGDYSGGAYTTARVRVPASEILHIFRRERPGQVRGVPWGHAAMLRLQLLKGYEEAELVAARVAACKMVYYLTPDGQFDSDAATRPKQDMEPGTSEILPPGWDLKTNDPTHPTSQFEAFSKSLKRGISAGLSVAYNTFASDLEGVNFSSIRAGVLEERDEWRDRQRLLIEQFAIPVYAAWLEMALATQFVPLPLAKFDKFNAPQFRGRSWPWVDPEKDMSAAEAAVRNGWASDSDVAADQGRDLEDVYRQQRADAALRETYGLPPRQWAAVGSNPTPPPAPPPAKEPTP